MQMNGYRMSNGELSFFCMELSLLLHAGVRIGDALALLASERDGKFRALLDELAQQVDDGIPLYEALRKSGSFPVYAVGLTEVGERTGRTEEALRALAHYYEERERMDRQVRSSLVYPAILLLLMLAVIVVLLTRVLPVFSDVYASLGGQLTGLAGGLLQLGRWLDRGLPVLCVLLALAVGLLAAFSSSDVFRARLLAAWQRWRGDRGVSRKINTARFAQALAMGMQSGLPLEEALELAAELQGDVPAAAQRSRDCHDRLERGEGMAEALRESGVLPAASCRLLTLGLRSGTADSVMQEVSRRLTEESQMALETAVGRVEPSLVLVTSLMVGMILLSVMLPLMNIMTAIG